MRTLTLLAALVCTLAATAAAQDLPAIQVKGTAFVNSRTGERFMLKGVAYQPRYRGAIHDPIADDAAPAWQRDLPVLSALGANAVRVYDVDPEKPHGEFMRALAARNMYLVLDLASAKEPTAHVNRAGPTYSLALRDRYLDVVDAFSDFPNLLAFVVGNEVSDSPGDATRAAPYVRALVRDVRAYLVARGKREIPLGYAASDNAATRANEMAFYTCGSKADGAVDWFGHNLYSWCASNVTFATSGYADRLKEFSSLGVPVVLSEFGCNIARPRTWPDVPAIYGREMGGIVSGAIAYEYSEEDNSYGLVRVDSAASTTATPLPDYENLQRQWAQVPPPPAAVAAKKSKPACPAVSKDWLAAASTLPPTPSECACQAAERTASASGCRPSLPANWTMQERGAFLGTLCGLVACDALGARDDTARGQYAGALAACGVDTKIAWAIGEYFTARGKASDACGFDGRAMLVPGGTSAASSGQESSSCVDRIPPNVKVRATSAAWSHRAHAAWLSAPLLVAAATLWA